MTRDDEQALERLVLRFWRDLDRRDYEAMASLLTEDCRWLRESWITGKAAISASLAKRPADLVTRHLITNLIVDAQADEVLITYLVTTFAGQGSIALAPLPSAAPALVADVEMAASRHQGRWLVSRIQPTIVFR